jgi:hypothetical protein
MYGRLRALALASITLAGAAAAQAPPPPNTDLPEQQRLRQFSPGGPLTPNVEQPRWPSPPNPLGASARVTDALLASPSANDWLSWRRTLDDQGFSPLKSIDKGNVGRLQLVWSLALPPGPNAATPLVHDGVLYVHSFGDNVQALDAASGDELWHYARKLPDGIRPTLKRNIALYGDKVYLGTSDTRRGARREDRQRRLGPSEPGSGFG